MSEYPHDAFALIGSITHNFEQCEFYLSEIFQLLCESENDAPFQVLGLIVSTELRRQMVNVALQQCLPRKSHIKTKIEKMLEQFRECQTKRNRAIHSAMMLVERNGKPSWHHRPLWHQTHRYKDSILKSGHEMSEEDLRDADYHISLQAITMKYEVEELSEFLEARKRRRLKRLSPDT
jgi:hypothetical protein